MRTLFCLPSEPFPPIGGAPIRNWQNINIMADLGEVAIFSALHGEPDPGKTIPRIQDWVYCNVQGAELSSEEQQRRQRCDRRWDGHEYSDSFYADIAVEKLEHLLTSFRPDLVIFEEIWLYRYLPIVQRYAKQHPCKIIFDNHNAEFEVSKVQNRMVRSPGWRGWRDGERRHIQIQYIENNWLRNTDQTWLCSDRDATLLRNRYWLWRKSFPVIPNGINVDGYAPIRASEFVPPDNLNPQARYILYAGAYDYPPNAWAAQRLVESILPKVQEHCPEAKLLLVGRKPSESLQQAAARTPNVLLTGTVPDALPYYGSATVMAAPLTHGSGTRLKILEAFASMCPVVCTAKASEGLAVRDGEQVLLRETDEAIAAGIVQVLHDPNLAQTLAQGGLNLVNQSHSWQVSKQKIESALDNLLR